MSGPPSYSKSSSDAGPCSGSGSSSGSNPTRRATTDKSKSKNEATDFDEPPSYTEAMLGHPDDLSKREAARLQVICTCVEEVLQRNKLRRHGQATLALVFPGQVAADQSWTLVGWHEHDEPRFELLPDDAGDEWLWSEARMQRHVQRALCDICHAQPMPLTSIGEVFLRMENQFGLYQTHTAKALILKIAWDGGYGE
ncbi:hypothetical protein ANO11243_035490 [Dothideomycetidae sp. 11243]|nr:hypothetical protein ANO11243_035490 [fungal sp. No.11243]